MGKTIKKILCTLLVVVMCLTSAPLQGFVDFEWSEINFGKWFGAKVGALEYTESYYTYSVNEHNEALIIGVDDSISGDIIVPKTLGGHKVTGIGDYAFSGKQNIASVVIPGCINYIYSWSFSDCDGLKEVVICNGVEYIGDAAFIDCNNLLNVTIPESMIKIYNMAFYDSPLIEKVNYTGTTEQWNKIEICSFNDRLLGAEISYGYTNEFDKLYGNLTYKTGDIIQFGSYPQSKVMDSATISALNSKAPAWDNWTSYGYYSGNGDVGSMMQGDWMRYIDITYNGNQYRGVKFTQYRPSWTKDLSTITYQDNNGYSTNTVYWFKFEPIVWRVLDPSTGFVMCKTIIDSQPYSNTVYYNSNVSDSRYRYFNDLLCTSYASDYETSSIRKWLNNDFYNTAFTANEKKEINTTTLNNDGYYTSVGTTGYENLDSNETKDKIFLLSYNEARNSKYGFDSISSTSDIARGAYGSDYAQSQGLYVLKDSGSTYNGNSHWILRSPGSSSFYCCPIEYDGCFDGCFSACNAYTFYGIRPALCLNWMSGSEQIPEHNAKYTIHTFASQPKLILGYGDAMTMKFELECHNLDAGENFLVSDPTFSLSSSDTDIFTVENIEKDGQTTSARLVSENPGNAILTVGAYANGKLVGSLQYLIAVEGECVYHIDTLINGKGDKDYNLYSYSNGIHIDNLDYVETGTECNLSFDVYNSVNCIAAVEVYSADGELLATKSISAFGGTLPTGIWDTFKQMYEFADKDYSNISYKDKEYSTKTEVTLLGVPTDGHVKITTDVEDSWACAFYNISDLLVDSALKIIDLAFETEDVRKKATEKLTDQILDKIMNDDNLKKIFEEIIRKYFQSVKMGSKEDIRDSLEEYVVGIESLDIDIGEIILDVLKGMGVSVAETVISFLLGPVKGFVETIFAVISFSKLIDHGVTVEELRGSKGSAIYFRRYASALRYSNGYYVTNSEPFPEDISFHKYKIVSGSTYNMATSEFEDAEYIDVISMALYQNGKEVSPNGSVQVAIPISDGMNIFSFKVYRQEADGSFQQLDCDFNNVDNGYIYITTDHFSVYVITAEPIKLTNLHTEQEKYTVELEEGFIPRLILTPNNAYLYDYTLTSSDESVAKITDSGIIIGVSLGSATITVTSRGLTTEFDVTVEPHKHILNGDVICEKCGVDVTDDCSCRCHKDNIFAKLIWNIINFFNKIFRKNQECDCGIYHY